MDMGEGDEQAREYVEALASWLRSSAESLAVGGDAVSHSRAAFGASSLFGPAPCVRAGPTVEEDVAGKVAVVSRAEGAAAEPALNCTDMALAASKKGAVGVIAINDGDYAGAGGATAAPGAERVTVPVVCIEASAFEAGAEAELTPTEMAAALLAEAAALEEL